MENKNVAKVESKSESQKIISQINVDIGSLYDVLRPVCIDNSKPDKQDEIQNSELIISLRNIECRLAELLGSIRI